jgi:regulatory protein
MNPTSNKSDFEDLTTNLRDLAYSYLEKYSPSKQQLKVYLLKKYLTKIKGTKSKKEVTSIIDEIILNLEKNRILNDEMYSDSKARMFLRRGYSLNKINQSLRNKGVESKFIEQSLNKIKEDEIEPDFVSALKLCKRRRIGPLRPDENREIFYKKDMGILARGGFSFDLSKRVLDLDKNEFNKLIKII